jgi:hypothetical protein
MVFCNKKELLAFLATSMKFFLSFALLSLLSPIFGPTFWRPFKSDTYGYPCPWILTKAIDNNTNGLHVFWPGVVINMVIIFCASFFFALGYRIIIKEEKIT